MSPAQTVTTAPKERPILFRDSMVRAILDGRKTQTRRVVKWKPLDDGLDLSFSGLSVGRYMTGVPASGWVLYSRDGSGMWCQRTKRLHCPYGEPGDRLWVREAWAYYPDGHHVIYRAREGVELEESGVCLGGLWKPSIHMPRKFSRLTLEIAEVRVERLGSIGELDAAAEGATRDFIATTAGPLYTESYREAFARSWDKISGKRPGCAYAENPWVWVVIFTPLGLGDQ